MIRSRDNDKLKTVRKLQQKHWRERLDLFAAEGEDLMEAADLAGWEAETVLVADVDVEAELLDSVSALGSGTRALGVYRRRWSQPGGELSVYLHGVGDPGNVGAVIRTAHALCDGPVVLGPGCADPFSPKAVRASMGSLFARPPARAGFEELAGTRIALDARAERTLSEVAVELAAPERTPSERTPRERTAPERTLSERTPRERTAAELTPLRPLVLCIGAEREGLPEEVLAGAEAVARITLRPDGPESLGAAVAAAVALYELANRMAGHA